MALSGIRNRVLRDLGLDPASSLVADAKARVDDYVNEAIDEVNILAKWSILKSTGTITLATDTSVYSLASDSDINKIISNKLFSNSDDRQVLRAASDEDFNKMVIKSESGFPDWWIPYGKDGSNNAQIRVYPVPSSTQNGKVLDYFYTKNVADLTADSDVTEFQEVIVEHLAKAKYAAYDQDFNKEAKHSRTANSLLMKAMAQDRGARRFTPLTRRNYKVAK